MNMFNEETNEQTLKPEWQYVEHPTIDEIRAGFLEWKRKYPDRLDVMVPIKSRAGRDVIFCKVTDEKVADDDKQIVFVTCTHVGMELNAATRCLHFIKWLIGDSGLAQETRRNQIVIVMPAGATDTYTEVRGPDKEKGEGNRHAEYWSWSGTLQPERNPEAVALVDMMKRYPPDVHVDLHGGPYKKLLDIPKNVKVVALTLVGYPESENLLRPCNENRRKPEQEIFCDEKFEQ